MGTCHIVISGGGGEWGCGYSEIVHELVIVVIG